MRSDRDTETEQVDVLQPAVVAAQYRAGASIRRLAARYHRKPATIRALLIANDVTIRRPAPATGTRFEAAGMVDVDAVIAAYQNGVSDDRLAYCHQVTDTTIRRRLQAAGIALHPAAARLTTQPWSPRIHPNFHPKFRRILSRSQRRSDDDLPRMTCSGHAPTSSETLGTCGFRTTDQKVGGSSPSQRAEWWAAEMAAHLRFYGPAEVAPAPPEVVP